MAPPPPVGVVPSRKRRRVEVDDGENGASAVKGELHYVNANGAGEMPTHTPPLSDVSERSRTPPMVRVASLAPPPAPVTVEPAGGGGGGGGSSLPAKGKKGTVVKKDSVVRSTHRKEEALLACADVCERVQVCWAKTTGFPYWPAQVVLLDARVLRDDRYRRSLHYRRKDDDTLVMYYGTKQYAWVNYAKNILGWRAAIARGLHREKKGGAKYDNALREAYQYAADKEFYPDKWWCEPKCLQLAADFLEKSDLKEPSNWDRVRSHMVRAEQQRVCWVTEEGKIPWPAQVMLPAVAAKQYPGLQLDANVDIRDASKWACMLFGTGDVGMYHAQSITALVTGLSRNYHLGGDDAKFTAALGDLWGYLQKPRVWPSGIFNSRPWWDDARNAASMAVEHHKPPLLPRYVSLKESLYLPGVHRPEGDNDIFPCTCHRRPDARCKFSTLCSDISCMNVASNYFCDPDTCGAGWRCSNVPFAQKRKPEVSPFYTADERGWGLRLDERVKKGGFICEYVGEIIDDERLHSRLAAKRSNATQDYYIMEIGEGLYIDSEKKGNIARFINSSCNPNCVSQKWTNQATGETHVGIFAKSDLAPGTELTFNYAFEDFGMQSKQKERSFLCRCGAPNCSTMNEQERLHVLKMMNKKIQVQWPDRHWYTGKVVNYDNNGKRFRVHYEDGDVELLTLGAPTALKGGDDIKFRFLTPE